jgi:hypothetical protein
MNARPPTNPIAPILKIVRNQLAFSLLFILCCGHIGTRRSGRHPKRFFDASLLGAHLSEPAAPHLLESLSMPRTTFLALLLMVGLTAEARASLMITTPAGIGGGQSFIVAFVDTTFGNAESSSISTYNAAIATAASGITYSDGKIGAWQILGATATADPAATAFSSSLPVYGTNGGLLGTSGSEWLAAGAAPNYNQTGTASNGRPVWTGLYGEYDGYPNGSAAKGYTLGSPTVIMGSTDPPPTGDLSLGGLDTYGPQTYSGAGDYYGWAIFTRAPEPSTFILALSGLISVGASRLARRRRSASPPAESLPSNS